MGVSEEKSKQKTRNKHIQKIILSSVLLAGGLTVSLVAPNALSLLRNLPGWKEKDRQKSIIAIARQRLLKAGLLVHQNGKLKVTPKGEAKLRQLELHDFQLKRPRRWDEKWRVLIFDIREERRGLREKIRRTLVAVGFIRLQDSVWVYPYDCEDLVALLKADFKIGKDLLYMIVDSLENDYWLRRRFGVT